MTFQPKFVLAHMLYKMNRIRVNQRRINSNSHSSNICGSITHQNIRLGCCSHWQYINNTFRGTVNCRKILIWWFNWQKSGWMEVACFMACLACGALEASSWDSGCSLTAYISFFLSTFLKIGSWDKQKKDHKREWGLYTNTLRPSTQKRVYRCQGHRAKYVYDKTIYPTPWNLSVWESLYLGAMLN